MSMLRADFAGLCSQHFRNTLSYIQARKLSARAALEEGDVDENVPRPDWEAVDMVGAMLKMGLAR